MSNETIDIASKELWERAKTICISTMQGENEKSKAERCFSMITSVAVKDDVFQILTSNEFAADTLLTEYGEAIKNSFALAGRKDIKIEFKKDENASVALVVPKTAEPVQTHPKKTASFISTMPIKEEYTFDEFVEGPSNSWALAASKGVAEKPGTLGLNPLFIHGGTGLGKTHLMQAIGNELKKKNPDAAVCYLTTEVFLNEYVNALSNNNLNSFRDRYRKIDLLLIDDIQFLQNNMQKFQEEFFNTFNALTSAEKQIVITSDVAPKDLPGIEKRLISRFEGGMMQEIESPAYETRLAILKKKSENMYPPVPENVLQFIAQKMKSHVRAMEGALGKVHLFIKMQPNLNLDEQKLTMLLKDFIEKEKTRKLLTVEEVQNVVAKKYSINISQIISSERTQSLVTPRQLAMYISRKLTSKSLPEIASKFGKSHATIIHGTKTIATRLDVEPELKTQLSEIIEELGYTMSDLSI